MNHSDFELPSVPPKIPLEHPMTKYNTQNNLNMSGGADTLTVPQDLNASETTNSITENLSSLIVNGKMASSGDLQAGGRKKYYNVIRNIKSKTSKRAKSRKTKSSKTEKKKLSSIKTRKNITEYQKKHRCCFLLKNGERCKNECVGIKKIKDNKTGEYFTTFVIQCKLHSKICENKYLKYKNVCKKIAETADRSSFLKHKICNNKSKKQRKQLIKNINKCVNGRIDYPIKCTNGCIVDPYNFKGYKLIKKNDTEHFNEIVNLIKNKLKCQNN